MSYKNMVNQMCADKNELFCRLRDFTCKRYGTYDYSLLGIGLELVDSVYTTDEDNTAIGDYFVVKIVGESGRELFYNKISFVSGYIGFSMYRYWDNLTHTGYGNWGTTNVFKIPDTGAFTLNIYGDLDTVFYAETSNDPTYNYTALFGIASQPPYDSSPGISTSSVSSGTDIVIDVDVIPTSWKVGINLYIFDHTNIEIIAIKSMTASSITVDLINGYDSGALLKGSMDYFYNTSSTYLYIMFMCNKQATTSVLVTAGIPPSTAYSDPELFNGEHVLLPYELYTTGGYFGTLGNIFPAGSGAVSGDVINVEDGTNFRSIKFYVNSFFWVKEV